MSFFKRNKGPMIPPVGSEPDDMYASRGGPANGAGGDPYANRGGNMAGAGAGARRGGGGNDPYANAGAGGGGHVDPYAQMKANSNARSNDGWGASGNPYARQAAPVDEATRNELFAGYAPQQQTQRRREYGYEGREEEADFDEDEEVEGIKQEMRGVKQESLASTRNAVRLAREAEETARGTIARLADQSERIANTERYLDVAKANNQRAEDKAEELRQLNRSIFRPVIVWNKDAKRAAQEEKINNRHAMERVDRAKALNDISDTRRRLGEAANPLPNGGRQPLPGEQKAKKEARARYQFDATASDDELEDELDENLDETYEISKRLKSLATAMGDEVTGQNARLTGVTDKTDSLEFAVMKNTERLKRIH
ncbi:hypothetical protein BD324DRAFT_626177 [Kockovaella imperatae]|uniref:t-SNARE coiled-coil homology domain-containing protein n=1 Tax=Kockovaella imperatae TaxID=4999 RepID=A0A1Y1UH94_9TREE|nr:hypothetical protein BD324DRAFT_626177 [Kockovaella imperatae]ORX37433.1 hypothetical protein BD324DRAFT_626177 [Kockovaella imperatae]